MNAQGPDLRDIHLPPAPSWWPPAPGWWLLAIVVLAAIAISLWLMLRAWRERRWRRRVLAELDRIAEGHAAQPDPVRLAADVSRLLRRASLVIEPRAAALHGEEWLEFLDHRLESEARGKKIVRRFRTDTGRALIEAPYRKADDTAASFDASALLALARDWLKRALTRRRSDV